MASLTRINELVTIPHSPASEPPQHLPAPRYTSDLFREHVPG
jgi:hypothetical protein